ncbi:MAG: hypothetical protein IJW70_01285 [Clostridia bacterium]|nr:hypothetical protein [Clostridia bacterium]
MKVLFKVLRFVISYFVSAVAVYFSGYGNLMDNVMPDVAARTFFCTALVLAIAVALVWEMYLKMIDLSKRIKEIEGRSDHVE